MEIDAHRGDQLTARVIHCIIHVHQTLGPGFLESVYRRAMLIGATCLDLALLVNFAGSRADFRRIERW